MENKQPMCFYIRNFNFQLLLFFKSNIKFYICQFRNWFINQWISSIKNCFCICFFFPLLFSTDNVNSNFKFCLSTGVELKSVAIERNARDGEESEWASCSTKRWNYWGFNIYFDSQYYAHPNFQSRSWKLTAIFCLKDNLGFEWSWYYFLQHENFLVLC